jgi:hypothetical protein
MTLETQHYGVADVVAGVSDNVAGLGGMDVLAATNIDGYVTTPPEDVARSRSRRVV